MQRRNRFLITLALGAIVSTSVMVYLLWGDIMGAPSKRREIVIDTTGVAESGPNRNGDLPLKIHRASRPKANLPGALPKFPERERFDSPETIALRQEQSRRVVTLLDEIMEAKSSTDRYKLNRELQVLLRKLGHRVDPVSKRRLFEMLITVDVKWRGLIGEAIGSMHGDVEVAKSLVKLLKERPEERYTRHAILTAITKIKVDEIKSDLFGMLGDAHPDEHLIVRALGQVAAPGDVKNFVSMLDDTLRPQTRAEIEKLLRDKRGVPGVMDSVVTQLGETQTAATKTSLLRIVGYSRDLKHAEMVRELAAAEKNPLVRHEAYKALGQIGDEESGKFLLTVLGSADANERRYAASALQGIKNPKTIDLFMEEWDTLSAEGKRAAMGSAARMVRPSKPQTDRALKDGLFDEQMLVRRNAIKVLGQRGRDEHVEPIVGLLAKSKHPSEWGSAFEALQRIGTKNAADRAMSMLHVVPDKRRRSYYMGIFEKIAARSRR